MSDFRQRTTSRLVGWYDGGAAGTIGTKPLPTPGVEVFIENGEELTLTVRYTLPEGLPAGVTAKPSVKLYYPTGSKPPIEFSVPSLTFTNNTATYEKVLDSLESDKQFKDLKSGLFTSLTDLGGDFTVTAGLKLSAVADGYIDSAYYATGSDNSLFAKGSTYDTDTAAGGTAKIANLRHLQNLCANFSEVGDGITKAEQTADIDCEKYYKNDGTTVLDDAYKFTPITNEKLSGYDGQSKHIRNLSTKTGSTDAGLFGTVSNGLTVQNTRVCWTDPEALVDGTDYVYAVSGTNAGGLIGAVTDGTVTINNSFAATTVRGTAAGGLVGSKTGSGTLTIERSYAAGFIVDGGTTTAGLVNGDAAATNCYSAVRVLTAAGTAEPATPMYTGWESAPGSAFYLSSPADVTNEVKKVWDTAFEYEDTMPETHVYDLRHKLDGTVETLIGKRYPFPELANMTETVTKPNNTTETVIIHYGDWAELDSIPAGLAYYEVYEGSTNPGVWGVLENGDNLHKLKKDTYNLIVKKDGYALVFEGAAPGKYVIQYGNGEYQAPWTLEGSPISVDVGGKTYTLLPLPDDIVTGKLPGGATTTFYQQLTCGTGANMRAYWFNPHFAKTVEVTKPENLNLPVTSIISVRTPRHFYDLSEFQSNYVSRKTYSFLQELDLDYAAYSWYGSNSNRPDAPVAGSGSTSYKQMPIGGSGGEYTFRGTYDGGCHKIKNVFFKSDSNDQLGLFGLASNNSSLKNIVYEMDPESAEEVSHNGTGGSCGALLGQLQGARMENCAVYGVNMHISGVDTQCGGLIGDNNIGGFITGCSAEVVSLRITGGWAGGLAGQNGGAVENSYAVGKIVSNTHAGGLINESDSGTVTNCYAAVWVDVPGQGKRGLCNCNTAGNVTNSGFLVGTFKYRGEEYTVESDPSVLTSYLGAGERITPDQLAEKITALTEANKTVKNFPDSYPTPQEDYSRDYAGNFPYLTGVKDAANQAVHYGLWPVAATEASPAGLAYYEEYKDSTNPGVWGVLENGNNLRNLKKDTDNPIVKKDGYALVFEGAAPGKYVIQYGNGEYQAPWTLEGLTPISVDVDGKTYTLLPLPDDIVTGKLPGEATTTFYQQLACGTGAGMRTYWFNPHFAKTVETEVPLNQLNNPRTGVISVRTPRHLYDLSEFQSNYKTYFFLQELGLDYAAYSWYGLNQPTLKDSVYLQAPIGKNADNAFTGTYNGGGKTIQNVVYDDNKADHYFGLFGYAGGTLTKINYITGGRTVNAAGAGNVHVGTLAGHAATMTDCTAIVSGSLDFSGNGEGIYGGGLAGRIEQAKGCTVTVHGSLAVKGTKPAKYWGTSTYAGGLAGYLGPNAENVPDAGITFTDCKATVEGAVTVTGTGLTNPKTKGGGDTFGGGLAGRVTDNRVTVQDCEAIIETLSISGHGEYTYGGGLTGHAGKITGCTAEITGTSLTVTGIATEPFPDPTTGEKIEVGVNAYGGGLTGGTGGTSANGSASGVTECSVVAKDAVLTVIGNGTQITKTDANDKHPIEGNEVYGGGLVGRTYGTVSGCKAEVKSLEVTGYGVFAYGGGLVGYANTMDTCTEVSISNVTVTGAGSETNAYGGGLAGQPHWGVTNCAIENSGLKVIVTGTGQDVYGGGLVARTFGTVEKSSAEIGTLTVTGQKGGGDYKRYVSGSGLTNTAAWVTNCDAIVRTAINVTGTPDNTSAYIYGAGLVGQPSQAVSTSTALVKSLTVEGYGPTTAGGGLVAYTANALSDCAAGVGTLSVTGNRTEDNDETFETLGGGLAGRAGGTVDRCSVGIDSLTVAGPGRTNTYTYAGGLVGSNEKGSVNLSYAVGRISTKSDKVNHVGGLVGYSLGTITQCYAAVDVPRITGAKCGGLVGQILDADNSYNLALNKITNSCWLEGRFRYRGDTYTMTPENLTDSASDYHITADGVRGKIQFWSSVDKTFTGLPAPGSSEYDSNWMPDYAGDFPYPGVINPDNDWSWKHCHHYGLWPIPADTRQAAAALPTAALPEPAAQPAGPGPKPKDENDPTP